MPVTFEFDNKGDIIPGSFVEIFLLSSPMENVISLPHTALTEEQGSFFVYLQIDEEGYKNNPSLSEPTTAKRCKSFRASKPVTR